MAHDKQTTDNLLLNAQSVAEYAIECERRAVIRPQSFFTLGVRGEDELEAISDARARLRGALASLDTTVALVTTWRRT